MEARPLRKALARARSWWLDILTALILALAVWTVAQPSSPLRKKWDLHRSRIATRDAARQNWSQLVEISIRLYDGVEPPTVIAVSDYECPFCRQASASVDSAIAGGARIAYLLLPRSTSPTGKGAALAAICADNLGEFVDMHSHLMRSEDWRTDSSWVREAKRAGVRKIEEFEYCMQSQESSTLLRQHRTVALGLALAGIPTFVSRSAVIQGPAGSEQLLDLASER